MKIVKILPDSSASKNYCANGVLRLVGINTASDVDGDVLMKSDGYNAVFKTTKKLQTIRRSGCLLSKYLQMGK